MIALELPDPPTANLYWRNWKGRIVKSSEARKYQKTVRSLAREQGVCPLVGEVRVRITWRRQHRRGDLDNKLKVVLDALKGIAWEDDSQIAEITAARFTTGQPSSLRLEAEPLQPDFPGGVV